MRLPKIQGKALVASIAAACALGMLGLALSASILYSAFCRATGYAGTTGRATTAPGKVLARSVEVRFDTNVAPGVPLEFTSRQPTQTLQVGQTSLAFFKVRNVSDAPVEAVATYNVAPAKIGQYFQKLECFCFKARVFQPGETMELPVVYFVDPSIADDLDAQEVRQITLSYTYFRKQAAVQTASAAP